MIIVCPVDRRSIAQFEEAVRDAVTHVSGAMFHHNVVVADTPGTAFTQTARYNKGRFSLSAFRPGGEGSRLTPQGAPSSAVTPAVYTAVMRELIKRFPYATITLGRVKYYYDRNLARGKYVVTYQDKVAGGEDG